MPGGVCVSDEVQHSIQNQENIETRSLGHQQLRNVARPLEVFVVGRPGTITGPPPARARFWNRGRSTLAALALAVVALLAWRIWDQVVIASGPIRSIAVLPLDNLSGDPGQEYFIDGMTEALITDLARVRGLSAPPLVRLHSLPTAESPFRISFRRRILCRSSSVLFRTRELPRDRAPVAHLKMGG